MKTNSFNIHGPVGKIEQADTIHNHAQQQFSVGLTNNELLELVQAFKKSFSELQSEVISSPNRDRLENLMKEAENAIVRDDRAAAIDRVGKVIDIMKSTFSAVETIGNVFLLFAGLGSK